jgi:hypothetical protein
MLGQASIAAGLQLSVASWQKRCVLTGRLPGVSNVIHVALCRIAISMHITQLVMPRHFVSKKSKKHQQGPRRHLPLVRQINSF